MNRITKVVISLGCNMFSVELAFNLLQRKVFAENKLDLYVLTFDTDAVKEMAEYIKTFGFSNMNELVATEDQRAAFRDADYLIVTTSGSGAGVAAEAVENLESLAHVFEKAELFDRLAGPRARVLVMGPRSSTWLQIFAEVATNLSAHNFTGLSRHYANEARELIARKLDCEACELSGVHIWGERFLDTTGAKWTTTGSGPANGSLQCGRTEHNVIEHLPADWVDMLHELQLDYPFPPFSVIQVGGYPPYMQDMKVRRLKQSVQTKANRQRVISAVCHHIIDWCRGTGDRKVCMMTIVQRPGHISDRIYSSYPAVIDQTGNISVVYNSETEPSIIVRLYRFYENQQKVRHRIRMFLNNTSKQTNNE